MKKLYTLILLTFIVIASCDTSSNVKPRNSDYFVKYYGLSGNQSASRVMALKDGFVMVGTSNKGADENIFVVRTDLEGIEQWNVELGTDQIDRGVDVTMLDNGNYVVVGNSINAQGLSDILVLIVSPTGEELNRTLVGDTGFDDTVADIIITDQGNILLAGSSSNTPTNDRGPYDFYFPKLTADLQPVGNWLGRYGFDGADVAVSVIQKPSGEFAFFGTTEKGEIGNSDKDLSNMIVFEISTQGLPNTNVLTVGTAQSEVTQETKLNSAGGFLLVGSTVNAENFSSIFVARVRSDNSLIGDYSISNQQSIVGKSIFEAQGGGYFVVGDITTTTGSNLYWAKMTFEGAVLSERTFGFSGDNTASDVIQLSDGSIVILGTVTLENQTKIALIKTNENGDLGSL